jgi:hypothetical protein
MDCLEGPDQFAARHPFQDVPTYANRQGIGDTQDVIDGR